MIKNILYRIRIFKNIMIYILGAIFTVIIIYLYESNIAKQESYSNFCGTCNGKTVGQCMQCASCGFISRGGYGKCVPGDMYGPHEINPDYENGRWIHTDKYWSQTLLTEDENMPAHTAYNNRYPYYEVQPENKPEDNTIDDTDWGKVIMKNTSRGKTVGFI